MLEFIARFAAFPGTYIPVFLFYALAGVLLFSAGMVVLSRNAVHAVLFLILAFFNAAGLFVLMGAEFVAMIVLIVYVGAVAVFFLFVVMMLDVDFSALRRDWRRYLPLGGVVGGLLLTELIMMILGFSLSPDSINHRAAVMPLTADVSNTVLIGRILYTDHILPFQLCGLVLLVAMIGAIVLTQRDREKGPRRQALLTQTARRKEDVIRLVQVPGGKGVEWR